MSKTLREILLESLKGELQAADFYATIADDAASEEVKHYALEFAAEEEKHFHSLVDWVEQDGNPALRAALQEVRLLLAEPSRVPALLKAWQARYSHTPPSTPLRALLETAMAKEDESIRYFRTLEEQVADPLSRRVLSKIRQDEERHRRFLEERYQQLFGDKSLPAS